MVVFQGELFSQHFKNFPRSDLRMVFELWNRGLILL
ncbi:Uncharacterised protein [Kingella negevensis]|uniref:Uncharacterized protein n=1 Tax=Kingella negevensis TaxID=1522312 RepID=A0A238HG13_9NEIS|nr:Uncharacterised protein [Kingella negevensis]